MKFDRIIVGFKLFGIALKARMMNPENRALYLTILRLNTDLSEIMTPEDKKTFHKFLNKIEEGCEK